MRVKDEHKESIIREKALIMLVEEGFDGFSMQKLAKASNVSPATIYLYFKNKEDLLNKLFNEVEQTFFKCSMVDFDPEKSFEECLWQQWKNRFIYNLQYPNHFRFKDQFRTSPLINHKDVKETNFKEAMKKAVHNAIERKELIELPMEMYWAIAYGPLYALIRFHLGTKNMMGGKFELDEPKMRQAFNVVVKALKP